MYGLKNERVYHVRVHFLFLAIFYREIPFRFFENVKSNCENFFKKNKKNCKYGIIEPEK